MKIISIILWSLYTKKKQKQKQKKITMHALANKVFTKKRIRILPQNSGETNFCYTSYFIIIDARHDVRVVMIIK